MELLLITLIALGLMIGIIYGLRRYQKLELEQNADRYNPLPPLDETNDSALGVPKDLDSLSDNIDPLKIPDRSASGVSLRVINSQHKQEPRSAAAAHSEQPQPSSTSNVRIIRREQVANSARASSTETALKPQPTATTNNHHFNSTSHKSSQATSMPLPSVESSSSILAPSGIPNRLASQPANRPVEVKTLETVLGESEPLHGPLPDQDDEPISKPVRNSQLRASESNSAAATAPVSKNVVIKSWQDRVAQLKRGGQLNEALAVCEAEYPLWGAYSQASIIVRAQLKDQQENTDYLDTGLQKLYSLAAQAELLHEKIPGNPPLSSSQLKKLELEKLADFELPYQKIGFTKLRLIKKTDLKLLTQRWGAPQNHESPREFCQGQWQALIAELEIS